MPSIAVLLTLLLWSLGATGAGASEGGAAFTAAPENPGLHEKPAGFKESFLDMREDVAEAAAAGRQVLLYFYQDGCTYGAKLLNDNFRQPRDRQQNA